MHASTIVPRCRDHVGDERRGHHAEQRAAHWPDAKHEQRRVKLVEGGEAVHGAAHDHTGRHQHGALAHL